MKDTRCREWEAAGKVERAPPEGALAMGLVRAETPAEYFKDLVESALASQHVETAGLTTYYLVNLLCDFVRVGRPGRGVDQEPLALQLVRALDAAGAERRVLLRALGDVSLFVAGVFSDSLKRRVVDVDYYVSMGEYAYASLSRDDVPWFRPVFAELADKFVQFVDVLAEVSERSALTSNADLLRLYERWLRTGSRYAGRCLAERGIPPNPSIGGRFLQ